MLDRRIREAHAGIRPHGDISQLWAVSTRSRARSSTDEGEGERARVATAVSRREDLGLLRLELGVGEDALCLQVGQILQL
jgi:hypothetical protein